MEKQLWSLDIVSMEEAEKLFLQTASGMKEPVLMCLLRDKHINPIFFLPENPPEMKWHKQEHGWLFCQEGELKWRRLSNGCIRFVYLGCPIGIPQNAIVGTENLQGLQEQDDQLIAWGIFDKGRCAEESIGQEFHYPIARQSEGIARNKNRMAFKIVKYTDPENGLLKFWRHHSMAWADTTEKE